MVDFIRKRLQVFVSSTFTDLTQERQAAVEAILTAGHIPAGMELFTSGDESQMEVINQWIDESDVYLLILGGRYGSVEPRTGKSYTHLEYEYALNKGKPLFACVVTEPAQEKRVREYGTSVVELDHPQKLREFRALVLTRMVKFWDDFKDIKIAISETLAQFVRRDDLTGWVRPSQEVNMPALADEIARLSKENADLRAQLAQFPQSTYEPITTWKEFFDHIGQLAQSSKIDHDPAASETDVAWNRGNTRILVSHLQRILAQLLLVATSTSTEGLIPKARQLVGALADDPQAAEQINEFRRIVAKHLRMPHEFQP
jgi:hypothetical protein